MSLRKTGSDNTSRVTETERDDQTEELRITRQASQHVELGEQERREIIDGES